ncbi:MAG: class II fructose-bisphosphatase [Nitriliruptorales bacterium]
MGDKQGPDRNLALELVRVTEAAALAAARWQGRGDKESGDQAAVDAMRVMLSTVSMDGVVVIGEGEKDEAPMLYNGEEIGTGEPPQTDIAVDPVEGTTLLAEGRTGAISVIALAPRDTMFDPGPAMYMEKIVVGPEVGDVVHLDASVGENLQAIARATGREVREVTVAMLERDRHDDLKRQIREAGARLTLFDHGDVAAGVQAAWEERRDVDVLMGIGGTPEGVIGACATKALGGRMFGRLWPRSDEEREALTDQGYDLDQVLTTDDLVASEDVFFVCTGITSGGLVGGVSFDGRGVTTESVVMRSKSGTIRTVRARHSLEKMREYASSDF